MKKTIACILLLASTCLPALAQNSKTAKLSPQTRMYLQQVGKAANPDTKLHGYVYKTIGNKSYISALIKINAELSTGSLDALGVMVGTKAGNIWTAQVPLEQVAAFTQVPGIEYIQLDEPMAASLDSARIATHVDSAHAGIGLPMPFTGKGVIVGVMDAGFDFHHPTFFDTTGTAFRIKKVWQQKTNGTPPTGFAYGNELPDSTAMWAAGTDNNTFSHGSHVTGIAAGSGFGGDTTNTRFRGMAYESDIALVGILPDVSEWINTGLTDVIDGLNYFYTYAASVSKPCVANLSWGTTIGPHDGSSLFSQACDNITGPGKIFVLAAGNNGGQKLHIQKTFTATDTLLNTVVNFDPALGSEKKTWIDVWGDTGKHFCVKISLYSGVTPYTTTGYVCLDDAVHTYYLLGGNNDTCFVTITTVSSDFNQKTRAFIDIYNKTPKSVLLGANSGDGTVNIWEGFAQNGEGYYGGFSTFPGLQGGMGGNANYTVGDIATTKSAITVAAYATKNIYTGVNNITTNYTTYATVGNIAPFSSTGPTIDGRVKPDITAPGLILGSAVNSYDTSYHPTGPYYNDVVRQYHNPQNNRDYSYGMMMGTSMASPAACGIIALMLQANPQLNPTQVKDILYATAIQDGYTGVIPAGGSIKWGGGKINAYRAVLDAVNHTTATHNVTNANIPCMLFPNPNNGSFTLGYYSNVAEKLNVEVQDVTGKLVVAADWNVTTGYNTKQFTLPSTAKGVYFTRLKTNTGSTTIKTVIQ